MCLVCGNWEKMYGCKIYTGLGLLLSFFLFLSFLLFLFRFPNCFDFHTAVSLCLVFLCCGESVSNLIRTMSDFQRIFFEKCWLSRCRE